MRYLSTRGRAPTLGFADAVLAGLATDGGLYVPEVFPRLGPADWRALAGRPYTEVATRVLAPFAAPDLDEGALGELVARAYATFDTSEVAPLVPVGDRWVLELFHGPTLAFKDVALQLLGHLFDALLARRGTRATILGATSGDTGSAAIAGCRGRPALDIVILHPHQRTSAVQRRQMTTVLDANVHNLAVRGTFDDCQDLVKALFRDTATREAAGLTAVNSINIARVLAQMVYYVTAALALGAPDRTVSFTVPTGNFGDILAGHWARRMGLPVETLVVATNRNDILARTLSTGVCSLGAVEPSLSPSMDIQVSSNFERLLFELGGDDPARVRALMSELAAERSFRLDSGALARLRAGFGAGTADDDATLAAIAHTWQEHGMLVDPHTAVGLHVAAARSESPMVVLATAHPAKFPEAVEEATGQVPALPPGLADLFDRPERYDVVDADAEAIREVVMATVGSEP